MWKKLHSICSFYVAIAAQCALIRSVPQQRASDPLQLCCSDEEWHDEVQESLRFCRALALFYQACEAQRGKKCFKISLPPTDPRMLQCIVEYQAGDPSAPSY